jgi:GNAT superfamily N-acetyltransferase
MTDFPIPETGAVLAAPVRLNDGHILADFDCGYPVMNEWLRKRALRNGDDGACRTFVICSDNTAVGYFGLAVGSVLHSVATGKVRRNMPDPIPVMILGRLAVDRRWRGHGIGSGMLRDAILKTIEVSGYAGIRALLTHAIDDEAKRFYEKWDFQPSHLEPLTMMITLQDARRALMA